MKHLMSKIKIVLLILIIFLTLILTGCADMVEIQERDFVMVMGVSYNQQLQITYALPNLNTVTGQSSDSEQNNLIRTFQGNSFPEIEEIYNMNSANRLDLRHLQAIVLDQSICSNELKMKELLAFINDNYDISNNVLVFYHSGNTQDLLEFDENIDGSIGDHLRKMNKNNQKKGVEAITIGNLIDSMGNNRTLLIPVLDYQDNSLFFDGSVLFQNNKIQKQLSKNENDIFYMMQGKGTDYLFPLADGTIVRINQVTASYHYRINSGKPHIVLSIDGIGKLIPQSTLAKEAARLEVNQIIMNQMEEELMNLWQNNKLDFLNLYEKSSYKNSELWVKYQNNQQQFIKDLTMEVQLDISLE